MFNKSFIQDCLEENADLADLDEYISYWHKNHTGRTLLEFLGLTPYEYQEWLRSEDSILSDILRCRREGINFEEIAKLPDETMGYTELHNYGYQGYAMYPLSAERALELYFHDIPIYHIYPDNTEQLMEDGAYQKLSVDIKTKNKEAIYGVEREVWNKRRENINEINLINMGRDYLKLYAKYDEKAAVILKDLNKESEFSLRFAENVEKDNKESMDAIIYNLTVINRVSTERKKYKEAEESERLIFLLKEYKNNKKLKEGTQEAESREAATLETFYKVRKNPHRITGYTPNNKPIYDTERITVTAEKLKDMYEAEKRRSLDDKSMNDRTGEQKEETNPFLEVKSEDDRAPASRKHARTP